MIAADATETLKEQEDDEATTDDDTPPKKVGKKRKAKASNNLNKQSPMETCDEVEGLNGKVADSSTNDDLVMSVTQNDEKAPSTTGVVSMSKNAREASDSDDNDDVTSRKKKRKNSKARAVKKQGTSKPKSPKIKKK